MFINRETMNYVYTVHYYKYCRSYNRISSNSLRKDLLGWMDGWMDKYQLTSNEQTQLNILASFH